jgi:hypothetical protein
MKVPERLFAKERKYVITLTGLLTVGVLSGYFTYFGETFPVWKQWTVLLHTAVGIAMAVLLPFYLIVHFQRTIGLRRPILSFMGIMAALLCLVFVLTGLTIVLAGQREAGRWIYDLHVWSSAFALMAVLIHIDAHRLFLSERRRQQSALPFPSLDNLGFRIIWLSTGVGILFVIIATGLYSLRTSPFQDVAAIQPYTYPYGEHPFRPSQTETATGGFLDAKRIGDSDSCAVCHQDIAAQWKQSIHAQAASDKTYQTNIKLLAEKKGMAATRYCEGCHAPAALLSGQLTAGGKLDTKGHLDEGVSCLSCHGIDRIEHVKGVASYRFAPQSPYLFEGDNNAVAHNLHNFLIKMQPRQHRTDMARDVLAKPELCATCHAQFMDMDFNGWGWVKMQDDYSAWLNSPYSQQTRQTYAQTALRRCQDCHFPLVAGNDPSANAQGLIKSHFNVGANTVIPWFSENHDQLMRVQQFLQSDQVRITLDKPNRPDATESIKFVNPDAATSSESPSYFYLGEDISIKVAVTNAQVGHNFPGGTTDINEVWVHFHAVDGQDRIIFESGGITNNGDVEKDAYFYRSTPIDRHGNQVWRHDLFNMVGDSFKRVIPPAASDVTAFTFHIPDWAKSPVTVTADLNYRKLNNRYAKWALKDENVRLPITIMASDSLTMPLRIQPEIKGLP